MNPLKKFRLSHGLTQSEVADLLDVTTRRVENWEQGISPLPKWCLELLAFKVPFVEPKSDRA